MAIALPYFDYVTNSSLNLQWLDCLCSQLISNFVLFVLQVVGQVVRQLSDIR